MCSTPVLVANLFWLVSFFWGVPFLLTVFESGCERLRDDSYCGMLEHTVCFSVVICFLMVV